MAQRFKLLRGTHVEIDYKSNPPTSRTYREGDVFDSPQNLLCYNGTGVPPQFELIHAQQEQYPSQAEVEAQQRHAADKQESKPQPASQHQGQGQQVVKGK